MVKLWNIEVSLSQDADDDKFIEVAVVGVCDYIISGDKDLLVLKHYKKIQIITPSEYLQTNRKLKWPKTAELPFE